MIRTSNHDSEIPRHEAHVKCDICSNTEVFSTKVPMEMQLEGWIVTQGKHFCTNECFEEFKNPPKETYVP